VFNGFDCVINLVGNKDMSMFLFVNNYNQIKGQKLKEKMGCVVQENGGPTYTAKEETFLHVEGMRIKYPQSFRTIMRSGDGDRSMKKK